MSDLYTFKSLAAEVLEQSATPLTAEEIWTEAQRLSLVSKLRSVGKTPVATLYSDLHRDTLDASTSKFLRVGSRPRRYWLTSRSKPSSLAPLLQAPQPPVSTLIKERDLHPLLAWFANARMGGVLVKTIFHEKSKKKTFGEWVHPDLVGVMFPRRALDSEHALQLSAAISAPLCRILSFELKLALQFGNLRESFFQAVSNSSWAHEAYLVASDVDNSPEFQDELERLCTAFGIGLIELDVADPFSSRVRIPAKARSELDWTTVDKLAEMNSDFAQFLKNVADDLKTDIHLKEYDEATDEPPMLQA